MSTDKYLQGIREFSDDLQYLLRRNEDLEKELEFLRLAIKMMVLSTPDMFVVVDTSYRQAADNDARKVAYTINADESGFELI
jgi:hypothetical protein